MKFEYEKGPDGQAPVAGIDSAGDLYIIAPNQTFAISQEDSFLYTDMDFGEAPLVKLFYPGDKLTITF